MKKIIYIALFLVAFKASAQVPFSAYALWLKNGSLAITGTDNGKIFYNTVDNKFYFRQNGAWVHLTPGASTTFGTFGQIPVTNSTNDGYDFSSTFYRHNTNNLFYATASFTNTNTGTQNNNFVLGHLIQFTGTGNIRWAQAHTEQGIFASNGTSGVMHNPTIHGGFNNKIEKQNGFNSFSCGIYNANNSYIHANTASTTSSMIFNGRSDTIIDASVAMASGYLTKVTKDGGWGHGFVDTFSGGSHTGSIKSIRISGRHAFGFFTNTSASNDSTGVWADWSAALGGLNPFIPTTSTGSVILSGNGILARANDPYQVYGPNFNITETPILSDTVTSILTWEATSKRVQRTSRSSFGAISGLTTNRLTFATSATTIGDDPAFTADGTNNSLGIDGARIHATGTDNLFFGDNAGNFTTTGTQSTGLGEEALNALTSGALNTATGSNALKLLQDGNANTAFGYNSLASVVSGLSNTAVGSAALQLCTGSNNTALGQSAGDNITSGSANIIIGRQRDAQSATASNQLDIQGIIFGTGNSATGTSVSTGNIGIGVAAPSARLNLPAGTTAAGTAPLKITSGTNLTTPEDGAIEYDGTNLSLGVSSTRYILTKSLQGSATLNFGSTLPGACSDLTITVTGAADGDVVSIGVPNGSTITDTSYSAWVSGTDTVTVRFCNTSLGSADPASGTFKVAVIK